MRVRGCKLPGALIEALKSGRLERSVGSWELREGRDAEGNPLETELGVVHRTAAAMARATADLSDDFASDGVYGTSTPDLAGPGAIPDILDFRGVVCFAEAGDGSPFCLDYRASADRPRVIWWDDVYWRVVAPDVEQFLALFKLDSSD